MKSIFSLAFSIYLMSNLSAQEVKKVYPVDIGINFGPSVSRVKLVGDRVLSQEKSVINDAANIELCFFSNLSEKWGIRSSIGFSTANNVFTSKIIVGTSKPMEIWLTGNVYNQKIYTSIAPTFVMGFKKIINLNLYTGFNFGMDIHNKINDSALANPYSSPNFGIEPGFDIKIIRNRIGFNYNQSVIYWSSSKTINQFYPNFRYTFINTRIGIFYRIGN